MYSLFLFGFKVHLHLPLAVLCFHIPAHVRFDAVFLFRFCCLCAVTELLD